jgi:hypothetical protein
MPRRDTIRHRRKGVGSKNISIDLDKQDARIRSIEPDSLTWNTQNEAIPRWGRSNRFDNKIFSIVQSRSMGIALNSNVSIPAFAGLYFTAAAHLAEFSSLAAVFDQYRLREIEVWLVPASANPATYLGAGTTDFVSVIDYDDANTPSSMDQLNQYTNVMLGNTINGHYRKFRPHTATAAYAGTFTGFQNTSAPWIDVGSGTVQHYGIKMGIGPTAVASAISVTYYVRIWAEFRNVY